MTIQQKEKRHILIALFFIFVYLSPMLILGENAHIRVHDNLDSNIAWYKTLVNSGQLFGSLRATIPQIINGLPRGAYASEFQGIVWLYMLFSPMVAYIISQALVRFLAFLGMYLLLKRHFVKTPEHYLIRVYVALGFALTPFWPSGMLATLGMPLALWAFLTIRQHKATWREWLTICLIPLYANFMLGMFFFLVAMGLLWLRDLLVKRQWNLKFFGSIALMTGISLAIEYRLVFSMLLPDIETSRNEFVSSKLSFVRSIVLAIKNYLVGHTHVMTLHTFVILPLSFLVCWFVYQQIRKKERWGIDEKRYVQLFVLNIVLSIWYAFWFYQGWAPLKQRFSLLTTFNFARFHFLRPLVIYLLFAVGCAILWRLGKRWKKIVVVALVLQIVVLFGSNPEIIYRVEGKPSFKEFYAEKEFRDIAKAIGKPKSSYRVVSIGIHPSIAEYNGFYTLDTYANYYPLSYKHEFRKIIAPELNKSQKLEKYFDTWGGRCYIFVSELGKNYEFKRDSKKVIRHLQLNTAVLKQMGGQYIFSAVPIENAAENNLQFIRAFDEKEAAWKIYLYQVK